MTDTITVLGMAGSLGQKLSQHRPAARRRRCGARRQEDADR